MKTVVVTGAGSGIGAAIAVELASRGWQVVATDLDPTAAEATAKTLARGRGQRHEWAGLDVTNQNQANNVAGDVGERLGLDAWVSNAGISLMRRFIELPLDEFERTVEVNLTGVFICGQAAASAMIRGSKGGTIINTASMAGKQGRVPYLSDYVASKFGVVGLTQAMAFELAEHDIRVNSVCPGYVVTPMQEREMSWEAGLRGVTTEEVKQMMLDDTPLRRLEQPHDVARVVAFLLSQDAEFMTGESIAVNGGAFMD